MRFWTLKLQLLLLSMGGINHISVSMFFSVVNLLYIDIHALTNNNSFKSPMFIAFLGGPLELYPDKESHKTCGPSSYILCGLSFQRFP